eukprot:SRR837773.15610.p4 GENE.SRR837773.15610~~SRR837773.15610.p4  ORF type:complete len:160 (-),score=19.97 SRR837773.15610:179-658(-)
MSCSGFLGNHCCMPRNGPSAVPVRLAATSTGDLGFAPSSSSRRPKVSKVVPSHSSLAEPSYDGLCRRKFVARSAGDPGSNAWPTDLDEDSEEEALDLMASPFRPPGLQSPSGAAQAPGGLGVPALPSLPAAWAATRGPGGARVGQPPAAAREPPGQAAG